MSPRAIAAVLAVVVAASIATQGYAFGIINHGLQIPLVRHFAGDATFDRDPFIMELARSYTTMFYPALGALARAVPIPPLFFCLFAALRAGSVAATWWLARALWKDDAAAIAAAAVASLYTVTFGLDFVSEPYLTHGALAQVLVLLALGLYARGRVVAAFAMTGVVFAVHGLHGAHAIVVLGVVELWRARDKVAILHLVKASAAFFVFAAPTLWWMRSAGAMGEAAPADYLDVVRAWAPMHFFPSAWTAWDWSHVAMAALLVIPIARIAGAADDGARVGRVALVAFAFAVVGGFAVELFPSPFLLRLHPIRASSLMALCGAPYVGRALVVLLRRLRAAATIDDVARGLTGAALLVALCMPAPLKPVAVLPIVPLLFVVSRRAPITKGAALVGIALGVMLALPSVALFGSSAALGFSYGFDPAKPVSAARTLALCLLALVAVGLAGDAVAARTRRRVVLGLGAFLGACLLAANALFLWVGPHRGRLADWRETQEWAAASLPAGDVVLVPLAQVGFRSFSNQTPAVDWQEGDAMLHRPAYSTAYVEKLRLYGWVQSVPRGWEFMRRLDALDEQLTTADARRIGAALGAKVAVRRAQMTPWELPVLHRNASYVVYRVE